MAILSLITASAQTWNNGGSGTWNTSGNWLGGVPNSVGAAAVFPAQMPAITVTVNAPITVGSISISSANGSGRNYTIDSSGGNSLTLDVAAGSASISSTGGNQNQNTISANIILNDNLNVSASATGIGKPLVISGIMSGAGKSVTAAGSVTFSGANTYSGDTRITSDTLTLGNSSALQNSTVDLNTLDTGTVSFGALTAATFGGLSGTRALGVGTVSLTVGNNNANASYSGVLTGSGSLTKTGTGAQTVSGANTARTGTTAVNNGTLLVNNLTGSGLGSGAVTVNSGGRLGGSGTLAGTTTVKSGGVISAGATTTGVGQVGQLNIAGATFEPTSKISVDMSSATLGAGPGWDFLNGSGGLDFTLANSGNKVQVALNSLTLAGASGLVADFDASQSYIWLIARSVTGISFASGQNESTIFDLLLGGFSNPTSGGTFGFTTSNGGKDLNLVFTPAAVPEPGTWALMILGGAGFAYLRRKSAK